MRLSWNEKVDLRSQALEKHGIGFLSFFVARNPEKFVGRMLKFIQLAEGEHDRVSLEVFQKHGVGGDGAAHANLVGLLSIDVLEHRRGRFETGVIGRDKIGNRLAGALGRRHGDARRGDLLDVPHEEIGDFFGVLVGDQPAGDLRVCLGRKNGLQSVSLKTAVQAVDLEFRFTASVISPTDSGVPCPTIVP